MKQDKSHIKTFEELHGQDTTGIDCPSTALQRRKEPEPSTFFTAAKVRAVAHCLACDKPRCIYSEKLSTYIENKNIVVLAIESNFYVYGSPLFPDSHPLFEFIRVRTNVACESPIERSYYSNKSLRLPPLCAHCGQKQCSIPLDLQQKFKQVLPICDTCCSKKLKPITYTPIKLGTKRKHPDT